MLCAEIIFVCSEKHIEHTHALCGQNVGFLNGKADGMPVPVAARSKAWVCGCSPAETVGSNPTVGHGCLSVVSVVCCQVEVSATG